MRIIFFLILVAALIQIFVVFIKGNTKERHSHDRTQSTNTCDQPTLQWQNLTEEERIFAEKVAEFSGTRELTHSHFRQYLTHSISELFASMPGWDMWDESIHSVAGQYERMGRAFSSDIVERIELIAYDPIYKLAKMNGKSNVYLTSHNRCSCPDFRKRHLPCKHMYTLAAELDGDISKRVSNPDNRPLYGLKFALAGHFAGKRDSLDGIRRKLNRLGCVWSEEVTFDCSALIVGSSPTQSKLDRAADYDMEIIHAEDIEKVFRLEEEKEVTI